MGSGIDICDPNPSMISTFHVFHQAGHCTLLKKRMEVGYMPSSYIPYICKKIPTGPVGDHTVPV